MDLGRFQDAEGIGEVVGAALREINVRVQAIEMRADATRIELSVDAILVSSTASGLQRFRRDLAVVFSDGPNGDDGLAIIGQPTWANEVVFFTDAGVQVVIPFHWGDDEFVTFTEDQLRAAWAINYAEYVAFADYAVKYVLDFLSADRVAFSDISVAWQGVGRWDEVVRIDETMSVFGGNTVALSENVTISEVMIGGPLVQFADAVRWSEITSYVMDYTVQPETVTITDTLVVSQVAASDARPGAFIPGAALLGSPQ